ncbi:hypothetical protein Fmac_031139 [Flemingia macrophylla]|uniref:Uncharacterized protein n=1 Tax=Flemingia macrophylla TaxID=520843 RepID=A0ABD1L185_9FABA
MESKSSFVSLLMERRKGETDHKKKKTTRDESAFVKAAAWAWHEHNTMGKTITEFDATITRHAPRPSRYKLEAMTNMSPTRPKKMPLLDEYEVQTISRLLESCYHHDNKVVTETSTNIRDVKKKKKVTGKGFWLKHGVVCGREEDVVDPAAYRLPTKVVKRFSMLNGTLM